MRKILYKLPVLKQIHELHLMVDELKKINADYKNEISRLKNEKLSRNEFYKVCNGIRRDMRYDFFRGLPREKYKEALCDWFYVQTGKRLNMDNLRTYNEKIQWMKLYDSTPLKTRLADKVAVREWVSEKIGEQYLVPCYGVWNCFEEINFDMLPDQFVLKANHGCGWNVIVKDKKNLDKDDARKKFHDWMGRNYAWYGMELHYKDIPPKIYAEQYLENNGDLYDYKFFCADGLIRCIQAVTEKMSGEGYSTIFDSEWNRQDLRIGCQPQSRTDIAKPDSFGEMKNIVLKLCEGFPFVRVDLYNIEGKIYFGEMTFTSGNGRSRFDPEEYNTLLGEMITLPDTKAQYLKKM